MDFAAWQQECGRRLGQTPRRFWFWRWGYLRAHPPGWLRERPGDPLWDVFRAQWRLLKEGRLMWGQIVQANTLLFEPGPDDCPASLLISEDPLAHRSPDRLGDAARAMFKLKGTTPTDPVLAEFARVLTDEVERHWTLVPQQVAGLRDTYCVAMMIFRKHLPAGYLPPVDLPYPVLALPGELQSALVVPGSYWPRELAAAHLATRR